MSVVEPPAQIAAGEAVTVTFGLALTVTAIVATSEHPLEPVPVTEYVVLAVGLTTIDAPVCPVLQL